MAVANQKTDTGIFTCDECEGTFLTKTSLVVGAGRDLCKRCEALEAATTLAESVTEFLDRESPCPTESSDVRELYAGDEEEEHDPDECAYCLLRKDLETYERLTGDAVL